MSILDTFFLSTHQLEQSGVATHTQQTGRLMCAVILKSVSAITCTCSYASMYMCLNVSLIVLALRGDYSPTATRSPIRSPDILTDPFKKTVIDLCTHRLTDTLAHRPNH